MEILILIVAVIIVVALFFSNKKKGNTKEQVQALEMVKPVIERNEQIINESLNIASRSKNFETAKSRIELAENKYKELEEILDKYPFLNISNLGDLESQIRLKAHKIENKWYSKLSEFNAKGAELEKKGDLDSAIKEYEKALKAGTDTPATFRRLAILYRKQKDLKNEKRVLNKAIEAFNDEWYFKRLDKLNSN